MAKLSKIQPCLWFDHQGEDASQFYCSIFPNSRITGTSHYTEEGREIHQKPTGTVMAVTFELDGQPLMALNGGPQFKFTEAVSLMVLCDTQAELDRYWCKLSADPASEVCGWCKDKFGLFWQIVPSALNELIATGTEAQRARVMKTIMASKKLDIAQMTAAHHG